MRYDVTVSITVRTEMSASLYFNPLKKLAISDLVTYIAYAMSKTQQLANQSLLQSKDSLLFTHFFRRR